MRFVLEHIVEVSGRGTPAVFLRLRCESATGRHPPDVMEFWERVCRDVGYVFVAQTTDSIVRVADGLFGGPGGNSGL